MKIEKINDKQIRCTLTREDLNEREIRLSELAYGSQKAKELFQDMMQMAAHDFGFEVDNAPLMVEAVPVSADSIILIITKVDDPEELDSRFSRFSSEENSDDGNFTAGPKKDKMEGADDILGLIKRISDAKKRASAAASSKETPAAKEIKQEPAPKAQEAPAETAAEDEDLRSLTRMYMFHNLDNAIQVSAILSGMYEGPNSLYKDSRTGEYYLLIQKADCPPSQFNKVCNILSEYAVSCKFSKGMDAFFSEHMELIVGYTALSSLAQLV